MSSVHIRSVAAPRTRRTVMVAAVTAAALLATLAGCAGGSVATGEPRDEVSYLRGRYNTAYFQEHNESFRYSAGFHFHHGRQHDLLQRTPLADAAAVDAAFDAEVYAFVHDKKARTEPTMAMYGPYVGRMAWTVYRTIDWTHDLHEQTYDVMADDDIPWADKARWTQRSVDYYLRMNPDVARSVAPLDVTMRRAGVMMKPYFTLYRNYYPRSSTTAFVAHWWHPAAYESMMIAGPDPAAQERVLTEMNRVMFDQVFVDRPQRMLLSRELMPRYARLAPQAANAFDNLHMLHGIVYDILAYEGWTETQKRDELYRVIAAMAYQPGDERLARKFETSHPDLDPRVYADWMRSGSEGDMPRIMREMMEEMMPTMMPDMTPDQRERMMAQFRMKMAPGMSPGELPGSLHDAMMAMMPGMRMMPGAMDPGQTPQMMVDAMLRGYEQKYGTMPDIAPFPMTTVPTPPAPLASAPSAARR